jgi:hypothetical protein
MATADQGDQDVGDNLRLTDDYPPNFGPNRGDLLGEILKG